MKLDLREELKRRDNTKGIQDVDKASTAELQRTVDTGSPSKGKAQTVIKRRKDAAAKASKAKGKDSDTSAENEKKQGAKDKKETNERYVGIHSALKAVQEGKGKKEYPSIRTILNKMNGE